MKISIPRIMIAGTHSGVGKTTIMSSLCRAFSDLGLKVKPFKCGPDYVDPSFHSLAAGNKCTNLDTWLMGSDGVLEAFAYNCQGYDLAIIEGVMGFYDGASVSSSAGSSADLANLLDCPVALICDASGMARSFAALVSGFTQFEDKNKVSCIIANRVGSESHGNLLQAAVSDYRVMRVRKLAQEHQFPDRHLGLVWAFESDSNARENFSSCVEEVISTLDLNYLLELARSSNSLDFSPKSSRKLFESLNVGLVQDEAFKFIYEDQLQTLRDMGAEISFVSALSDNCLPEGIHGLIIPGGYPELFAAKLSKNKSLMNDVRLSSEKGMPIYGECGGLMYLCKSLTDIKGDRHEMVGVFDQDVIMQEKLQELGYVEVVQTSRTILGPEGTRFRGHQFRYSTIKESNENMVYSLVKKRRKTIKPEGYYKNNTLGSYVHGHWASQPNIPKNFLRSCELFRSVSEKMNGSC